MASATYTITGPDLTSPILVSASMPSNPTKVHVVFSEAVEAASAEKASNYALDGGINVMGISLGADLKTVTLMVSSLSEGNTYKLTVNNVSDRATTPNTIVSDSQVNLP